MASAVQVAVGPVLDSQGTVPGQHDGGGGGSGGGGGGGDSLEGQASQASSSGGGVEGGHATLSHTAASSFRSSPITTTRALHSRTEGHGAAHGAGKKNRMSKHSSPSHGHEGGGGSIGAAGAALTASANGSVHHSHTDRRSPAVIVKKPRPRERPYPSWSKRDRDTHIRTTDVKQFPYVAGEWDSGFLS